MTSFLLSGYTRKNINCYINGVIIISTLISFSSTPGKAQIIPSFESFYKENYSKVLFYLVKKMPNKDDAEDLAGEVFLYCYSHYGNFDPSKSSITTWLFLVVNSRLKNYYRDKKEHMDIGVVENYLYDESDDMERAVYLEQLRNRISACLEKLPERQREVVVLRYFKEMEYEDIAARLGVTPGNIRVILSRALDKMEKDFEDFI